MMRMVLAAAMLAASSLVAPPAAADSPVSLPQLAPGEVLLEVNAVGIARSPATSATITVNVTGRGASEADARRALDAEVRRISASARAAGASQADIEVTPTGSGEQMDDMMNVDLGGEGAASEQSDEQPRRHYASSNVVIRLSNPRRAADLHQAVQGREDVTASSPDYELADERPARRTARAEAIQNARADAESYAAALGMRIVRILRVTERTGLDFVGMALSESNTAMRTFRGLERSRADAQVETYVLTGVDFVLAPR